MVHSNSIFWAEEMAAMKFWTGKMRRSLQWQTTPFYVSSQSVGPHAPGNSLDEPTLLVRHSQCDTVASASVGMAPALYTILVLPPDTTATTTVRERYH